VATILMIISGESAYQISCSLHRIKGNRD